MGWEWCGHDGCHGADRAPGAGQACAAQRGHQMTQLNTFCPLFLSLFLFVCLRKIQGRVKSQRAESSPDLVPLLYVLPEVPPPRWKRRLSPHHWALPHQGANVWGPGFRTIRVIPTQLRARRPERSSGGEAPSDLSP